jgi:hypothetical protein
MALKLLMVLAASLSRLLQACMIGLPDGCFEPLPAGVADGHVREEVVPVVRNEAVG